MLAKRTITFCVVFALWSSSQDVHAQTSGVWTKSSPTGTPPSPRNQVSSHYDVVNDRLFISGGNNYGALQRDVWVLANATQPGSVAAWSRVAAVGNPPVREAHVTGYDPGSNRLVIHGGWPGLVDTWVLTNADGTGGTPTWVQLPSAPFDRTAPAYAYDAASRRLIVYGGLNVDGYTTQGWHN